MLSKEKIYTTCLKLLDAKIALMQSDLSDLMFGAINDSKSTSGDKHETARAMMHAEYEKTSRQLAENLKQKHDLEKLSLSIAFKQITIGSLVKTNKGYFYISIALGRVRMDDKEVVLLSPQSPLGKKLMGLHLNDFIEVNNVDYKIEAIS